MSTARPEEWILMPRKRASRTVESFRHLDRLRKILPKTRECLGPALAQLDAYENETKCVLHLLIKTGIQNSNVDMLVEDVNEKIKKMLMAADEVAGKYIASASLIEFEGMTDEDEFAHKLRDSSTKQITKTIKIRKTKKSKKKSKQSSKRFLKRQRQENIENLLMTKEDILGREVVKQNQLLQQLNEQLNERIEMQLNEELSRMHENRVRLFQLEQHHRLLASEERERQLHEERIESQIQEQKETKFMNEEDNLGEKMRDLKRVAQKERLLFLRELVASNRINQHWRVEKFNHKRECDSMKHEDESSQRIYPIAWDLQEYRLKEAKSNEQMGIEDNESQRAERMERMYFQELVAAGAHQRLNLLVGERFNADMQKQFFIQPKSLENLMCLGFEKSGGLISLKVSIGNKYKFEYSTRWGNRTTTQFKHDETVSFSNNGNSIVRFQIDLEATPTAVGYFDLTELARAKNGFASVTLKLSPLFYSFEEMLLGMTKYRKSFQNLNSTLFKYPYLVALRSREKITECQENRCLHIATLTPTKKLAGKTVPIKLFWRNLLIGNAIVAKEICFEFLAPEWKIKTDELRVEISEDSWSIFGAAITSSKIQCGTELELSVKLKGLASIPDSDETKISHKSACSIQNCFRSFSSRLCFLRRLATKYGEYHDEWFIGVDPRSKGVYYSNDTSLVWEPGTHKKYIKDFMAKRQCQNDSWMVELIMNDLNASEKRRKMASVLAEKGGIDPLAIFHMMRSVLMFTLPDDDEAIATMMRVCWGLWRQVGSIKYLQHAYVIVRPLMSNPFLKSHQCKCNCTMIPILTAMGEYQQCEKLSLRILRDIEICQAPVREQAAHLMEVVASIQAFQGRYCQANKILLSFLDTKISKCFKKREADIWFLLAAFEDSQIGRNELIPVAYEAAIKTNSLGTDGKTPEEWFSDPSVWILFSNRFAARNIPLLSLTMWLTAIELGWNHDNHLEMADMYLLSGNDIHAGFEGSMAMVDEYSLKSIRWFSRRTSQGKHRSLIFNLCSKIATLQEKRRFNKLKCHFQLIHNNIEVMISERRASAITIQRQVRSRKNENIISGLRSQEMQVKADRIFSHNALSRVMVRWRDYAMSSAKHTAINRIRGTLFAVFDKWRNIAEVSRTAKTMSAFRIQRCWRKRKFRRDHLRHMKAKRAEYERLTFFMQMIREERAVRLIIDCYRRYRLAKIRSPEVCIQAIFRARKARELLRRKRIAAIHFQRVFRGFRVRQEFKPVFQQHFMKLAYKVIARELVAWPRARRSLAPLKRVKKRILRPVSRPHVYIDLRACHSGASKVTASYILRTNQTESISV